MAENENRTKTLEEKQQPTFGWVSAGNGWYFAPDGFAQTTAFFTDDFEKFSRRSRARWDLLNYLRTIFSNKEE